MWPLLCWSPLLLYLAHWQFLSWKYIAYCLMVLVCPLRWPVNVCHCRCLAYVESSLHPRINLTLSWSWWVVFFSMCCWIQFTDIRLRMFVCTYIHHVYWPVISPLLLIYPLTISYMYIIFWSPIPLPVFFPPHQLPSSLQVQSHSHSLSVCLCDPLGLPGPPRWLWS